MTREQKLGLIIGFAVVLVFGVLIADHFSRARSEPLLTSDPVDEPLVIPRVGGLEPPARGSLPLLREPLAAAGRAPAADAGSGLDLGSIFGPVESDGGRSARSVAEAGGANTAGGSGSGVLPGFVRVGDEPLGAGVAPAEASAAAEPADAGPARVRTHRVREGENLYRIAERYYGNGHLWRRLATANGSLVTADGQVSEGAVLRIPSPDSISGASRPSRSARAAAAASPGTTVVGTYTVQRGDTLSEISQRLLGTVRRMDDLIEMNRGLIENADDIRVGMTLRYERGPEA
ncbi:MAG: LysM domain-containing protein [Planctomycetota bacterium]